MIKSIPLHALIIAVGPSAITRDAVISAHFPDYEVVSARRISHELVGAEDRLDLNTTIYSEVRRRILLKLDLGERVVVDAPNLRREDRVGLARSGIDAGVPVFYLLCDPDGATNRDMDRFVDAERDILAGDGGLAEVIDTRVDRPDPVPKQKPNLAALRRNWSGITVIGDVHGMCDELHNALAWARARNHYVIFLGDVVDYGPQTLEAADEVYRVVMRGDGELLLGNHERKIARWISDHYEQRLSDGNRVTTDALGRIGAAGARRWQSRFRGLVARASLYRHLGNMVFAHAAIHPGYWQREASPREMEHMALLGEIDGDSRSGQRPTRTYRWVNSIPQDTTVMVGHDIRSVHPLVTSSSSGGTAVFLDTGSGKGGRLASADLKFCDAGLRIENFNLH